MHTTVISAYILGIGALIVCLFLAIIVSNCIKYEAGSDPKDGAKRRMWYWIFCVICLVLSFVLPYAFVFQGIKVPSKQTQYLIHMAISTGLMTILYIVFGMLISKVFSKHGKLSNWF